MHLKHSVSKNPILLTNLRQALRRLALIVLIWTAPNLMSTRAEAANQCKILFGPAFSSDKATEGKDPDSGQTKTKSNLPIVDRMIPDQVNLRSYKFENVSLPSDRKDPAFRAALADLLDMMTETVFENVGPKITVEKGEMRLARSIGDGQSIEFEYKQDERSGGPRLRLDRIILYKPNGQPVPLDKSPVTDNGKTFMNRGTVLVEELGPGDGESQEMISLHPLENGDLSKWSEPSPALQETLKEKKTADSLETLKAMAPLLTAQDQTKIATLSNSPEVLRAPIVIEGEMFKEVMVWSKRMPFLPRASIRASLDGNHISRLIWMARIRSNVKVFVNRIRRKLPGTVVFLALIFGAQHAPHYIESYISALPSHGFGQLLKNTAPIPVDQSEIVNQVLAKIQARGVTDLALEQELSNRFMEANNKTVGSKQENHADNRALSNFTSLVAQLTATETAQGGQVTFFLSDLVKHTSERVSAADLNNVERQTSEGYLIAAFLKTQRILLVPIVQETGVSAPEISVISIDRANHQQVYDLLLGSLPQ